MSAKHPAHSDQANQAAVRWLIPPTPRPRSLAFAVTTPLYMASVSQALRQTLRGSLSKPRRADFPKYHLLKDKRCMLGSVNRARIFRGACRRKNRPLTFRDPPHPATCRWFYVSAVRPLVPAAANLYYVHCGFIAICHYGGVGHYHGRRNEAVRSNRCWEADRRTCGRSIIAKYHPSNFSRAWTSPYSVTTTEETREVSLCLSWTGSRRLLLIRVLFRGFIQRVEELVALGYGYLQSLVRRLARFAFPDEPPSAPVDHGIPILTVVSHPPEPAPALPATSYQPDFSGVWAKIERAKEHLDALRRETGLGIGTPIPDTYRIPMRLEYEPSSGDHVFRATATIPEDAVRRVGILVGDIAHNLRSALDHLVWQLSLVRTKGREPSNPKIIQFPIQDSPPPKLTDKRTFLKTGRSTSSDLSTGQSSMSISPTKVTSTRGMCSCIPWRGSASSPTTTNTK
jgi:hypothetical protein